MFLWEARELVEGLVLPGLRVFPIQAIRLRNLVGG
jgi:hypothetical protein